MMHGPDNFKSIFRICTLVLISVIYPSHNTSLKMAAKGGQDMQEIYNIYTAINSHNFICTHWFYSEAETSVHGHKIFKILYSAGQTHS